MSDRLKEYFAVSRIKKIEFCQQIGCSTTMLYYILTKKKRPSPKLAKRIVEVTRGYVNLMDLYED